MNVKNKLSLEFYYEILRIRKVEEKIAAKYAEKKMRCPCHLSIGQEAVAVGVCKAALHSDIMISNHRAHAHYLAKGGNLQKMIAEIYGKSTGCCNGRGGSMHLVDLDVGFWGCTPIVGGSIPVGVGIGFSLQMKKEDSIAIVCFGDASTEEGVWAESLNFAALKKLPVLFLCENNLYSVHSPFSVRQSPQRDAVAIACAHGIKAEKGDGNNVEQVYEMTKSAIQSIREGNGSYYLEFQTYRFREHCGPLFDDDLGYRSQEELESWRKKCPLASYKDSLLKRGELDEESIQQINEEIDAELEEAFSFAEQSPFPNLEQENESYLGFLS